jgi:hypothetical protein
MCGPFGTNDEQAEVKAVEPDPKVSVEVCDNHKFVYTFKGYKNVLCPVCLLWWIQDLEERIDELEKDKYG